MPLSTDQLQNIPLFSGLSDPQLAQLAALFAEKHSAAGENLFAAGDPVDEFYVLTEGEVTIAEGEQVRYQLHPPAPIGELGALAGLTRNTTATVGQDTVLWAISRRGLLDFFEAHREIALPFYQNLVQLIADKVRRDQIRLEDMRLNIIRTQKAMKQMRDFLLESEETPVSEQLHNTLEEQIRHNRRANYRVRPPSALPAGVRPDGRAPLPVVQISRTHVSFLAEQLPVPGAGSRWSGVLLLAGPEIPISGKVLRTIDQRVDLELDLLLDEYGATLDGYLTRVQMLDFMV